MCVCVCFPWVFLYTELWHLLLYFSFSFLISICCNFFFFFLSFCLIALARTSRTLPNRSGESRHSCLIFNHKKKAFKLSLLRRMLVVGFSQMYFISSFLFLVFWEFYYEWLFDSVKFFFVFFFNLSGWQYVFFFFILLMWYDIL